MADPSFEARLQRLYSDAPAFADASVFASRVEARLDRGWGLRRLMVGTGGLAGGVIAVAQLAHSDAASRFAAASALRIGAARQGADVLADRLHAVQSGLHALPFGGEAMGLIAAMALLALALAATRLLEAL